MRLKTAEAPPRRKRTAAVMQVAPADRDTQLWRFGDGDLLPMPASER
jgi:hypothetical protein